jgi:hypothetical protein
MPLAHPPWRPRYDIVCFIFSNKATLSETTFSFFHISFNIDAITLHVATFSYHDSDVNEPEAE